MKLNVDDKCFGTKPTKKDIGGIQKRIGNLTNDLDSMSISLHHKGGKG